MPKNIKIQGDDAPWKRAVDEVLLDLQKQIDALQTKVKYLETRVK